MTVPDDTYTHGHHESVLRAHRWRNAGNSAGYLVPHLRSGQRLLDVGCGPGTITLDLARRVLPGEVVGVDREEEGHDLVPPEPGLDRWLELVRRVARHLISSSAAAAHYPRDP